MGMRSGDLVDKLSSEYALERHRDYGINVRDDDTCELIMDNDPDMTITGSDWDDVFDNFKQWYEENT